MSYQPNQPAGMGQPYGSTGGQFAPPRTSGKAVAALILGLGSILFNCLTGLPAIILGILAMGEVNRSRGSVKGTGLAITGILAAIFLSIAQVVVLIIPALLLPAIGAARGAAQRQSAMNDLKMVGLAMHNHASAYQQFPQIGSDPETIAALSWRVRLLPYMEDVALFEKFDFESGWEAPQNRALAASRPAVYAPDFVPVGPEGTSILAVTGPPGAEFEYGAEGGANFGDASDGTSNTAMAVISDGQVMTDPWISGKDLVVDPSNPARGLYTDASGAMLILFMDGSVRAISGDVDPNTLHNVMRRNDGEVVFLP